jgi:hypothetical protein
MTQSKDNQGYQVCDQLNRNPIINDFFKVSRCQREINEMTGLVFPHDAGGS